MDDRVYIAGSLKHSSVNGPGVRYVLFFQGCPHHCYNCQNPETWNMSEGTVKTVDEIVNEIKNTKYLDGVTFSGGDPLLQADKALAIAKELKKSDMNIWIYTGWIYEDIVSGKVSEAAEELLKVADVLIDGPFINDLLSSECIYRGSTNQRLIDLANSTENEIKELDL